MKTAYFDPVSGVSGDMFVGALIDLGASFEEIQRAVGKLGIEELLVRAERVESHGIPAVAFEVIDAKTGGKAEDSHGGPHRSPSDLIEIIEKSGLDPEIAEDAVAVVSLIGEAEALVHGVSFDEVHLHEVGALDTLADAVAASAAFRALGIEKALTGPVAVGSGTVKTAHGVLPVPAPATKVLLQGFLCVPGGPPFELTTPTGAALLRHFTQPAVRLPEMKPMAEGFGRGRRDIGLPNVCRVFLGESR